MNIQDLRIRCIELALQTAVTNDVVRIAREFENYISESGTVEKAETPKAKKKEEVAKAKDPLEKASTTSISGETDGAVSEITYDQVKSQILEVAKIKGREGSLQLLNKFGVVKGEGDDRKGNMTDLKPEQYPAVIEEAKAMLAA